jgi:hypothetical protein
MHTVGQSSLNDACSVCSAQKPAECCFRGLRPPSLVPLELPTDSPIQCSDCTRNHGDAKCKMQHKCIPRGFGFAGRCRHDHAGIQMSRAMTGRAPLAMVALRKRRRAGGGAIGSSSGGVGGSTSPPHAISFYHLVTTINCADAFFYQFVLTGNLR